MREFRTDHPGELIDTAQECIVEERRRTTDELHALETFVDEIRALQTESVSFDAGVATITAQGSYTDSDARGLRAVRDAYEATVMSVPHYEEEYNDTYETSVAEEFGPDLATALTRRSTFDEQCKRAVLSAATEARTPREALLTALDNEVDSLDAARERLRPIAEEVAGFTAPTAEQNFETLDAYRARLAVLEQRCEELAASRQSTLREQRRSLRLPVDGPDVPTYVYQSLDADYPVLSAVAAVVETIEETRTSVERAMGYCN